MKDSKRIALWATAAGMVLLLALLAVFGSGAWTKVSAQTEGTQRNANTVYAKDGGKGDGSNPSSPLGSISAAVKALSDDGGVIVVCGPLSHTQKTEQISAGDKITITSFYDGRDYRKSAGAKLLLCADMISDRSLTIEYTDIRFDRAVNLFFNYRSFTIGEGVQTYRKNSSDSYRYPIIFGGYEVKSTDTAKSVSCDRDVVCRVDSGTWNSVICGNYRSGADKAIGLMSGRSALVINGGKFNRTNDNLFPVSATGMNYFSGDVVLEINGGEFDCVVYGVMRVGTEPSAADKKVKKQASGDVLVRITDGKFSRNVGLTCAYTDAGNNAYNINMSIDGDSTFVITGGSFSAEFNAYCACGDLLLKYDPAKLQSNFLSLCANFPIKQKIDATKDPDTKSELVSATIDEQIDKKGHGNDPYIVKDPNSDAYYYVYSSGGVKITKCGNIGLFKQGTTSANSAGVINFTKIYNGIKIVDAAQYSGSQPCKQYWAPEIHYIPREIAGDDYGWYCYVAASDSSGADDAHRMYVYKCPDPENPMCQDWELKGKITDSANYWAIDGTLIMWKGEMYFAWSGRESKDCSARSQNICIAKMSNPWTLSEERTILSTPSESWERYQTSPAVNEGPQAFVNNGKLYLTYSANGSWAKNYCFGLLSYNGEGSLSDVKNWTKRTEGPFFSRNSSVSGSPYGTGHGTVLAALDGTPWIIFHANPTTATSSSANWWSRRMVYAQPLELDSNGEIKVNYAKAVTAENTIPAHNGEYCTQHLFYELSSSGGDCKTASTKLYECLYCGSEKTEQGDVLGHSLGEWYVSKKPSVSEEGEHRRDCAHCSYFETKSVDSLPSETSAPETSSPETSAAETSSPETSAPVTSAPATSAPESSSPSESGVGSGTESAPVFSDATASPDGEDERTKEPSSNDPGATDAETKPVKEEDAPNLVLIAVIAAIVCVSAVAAVILILRRKK